MLEKMNEFFNKRIGGYEEHQLNVIEGAQEFYPYTAACLPIWDSTEILDLGCGTGLELDFYFKRNPTAKITGIDMCPLYKKIYQALKHNGYLIITDYFAETDEHECFYRQELLRLELEQEVCDDEFYHYDTPLTKTHELEV